MYRYNDYMRGEIGLCVDGLNVSAINLSYLTIFLHITRNSSLFFVDVILYVKKAITIEEL